MPPRAVGSTPHTNVQEVSDRKVLPFRREPLGLAAPSPLESELRELEYGIRNLGERPIPAVMARVVEQICSLTHADGAALALRDEQGVFCLASTGDAPDVGSRLQPDSGLTRECFETAQTVVCDDAEKDSRVRLAIARSLRLGSALAVPIQEQGSVLGVVEVFSSRPAAFDGTHVAALERVARSLAPVLAPPPALAEERAPVRDWLAVGAAVVLVLGLLFWWAVSHRRATTPPSPVIAPSAVPAPPSQAEAVAKEAAPGEATSAASSARSSPEVAPPSSASPMLVEHANAPPLPGVNRRPEVAPPPSHAPMTAPVPPIVTELAKAAPPPAVTSTVSPAAIAPVIPVPDFALQRTLHAHAGWVSAVSFTADGQRLVSGSWDKAVKFWDVNSGQQLGALGGENKEIEALAVSPDGRWVAAENPRNTVILWDTTTGREVHTLPGHRPPGPSATNWVYSIAFSPDGRWLASGVDDKTVRLWDVATGRALRDLGGQRRSVIYIAVSPDGRWLASGGDSKTIQIWDVATGQVIQTLSGHKKDVYAAAFSPRGRWLASASGDKTVKLWDLTTGREVHTLTGHRDRVTSLAFSPDGRWLASGSWDKTIKIWDVESGRELQTVDGHGGHIYTVAFDSRGRWLASGSETGAIQLWRLRPAQAAIEEKSGVGNRAGSAATPER